MSPLPVRHPLRLLSTAVVACVLSVWAAAGESVPLPASTPWLPGQFDVAPPFELLGSHPAGEVAIKALWFRGPGSPTTTGGFTKVFAYFGRPAEASARTPAPALVLIHGWDGQAMSNWVVEAVKRGYVALAISTNGRLGDGPVYGQMAWPEEFRGPGDGDSGPASTRGLSPFEDRSGEDPTAVWMYHAVANGMLANSLLRSFPEVDAQRIGLWGISWGGFHTCVLAGVDPRFRVAVPMYGCGYLAENGAWVNDLASMSRRWRQTWVSTWDPSTYLPSVSVPMFFFNGDDDRFYPLDSWMKSYRLVPGRKNLCVMRGFGHGHFWDERVQPVWQYLESELVGGPALPYLARPVVAGSRVSVEMTRPPRCIDIRQAMLCYTTGPASENGTRTWREVPLTISATSLSGNAPPSDATAWYVSVNDTADPKVHRALVSSEVIFAP